MRVCEIECPGTTPRPSRGLRDLCTLTGTVPRRRQNTTVPLEAQAHPENNVKPSLLSIKQVMLHKRYSHPRPSLGPLWPSLLARLSDAQTGFCLPGSRCCVQRCSPRVPKRFKWAPPPNHLLPSITKNSRALHQRAISRCHVVATFIRPNAFNHARSVLLDGSSGWISP